MEGMSCSLLQITFAELAAFWRDVPSSAKSTSRLSYGSHRAAQPLYRAPTLGVPTRMSSSRELLLCYNWLA